MASDPHDTRALDLLRLDVEHYRVLFRALYACAVDTRMRLDALERQLSDTREELRRYTAHDGAGRGD